MLGSSLVTRSRVSVWDGPGVLANRNAAITDDMRTGVWMFRDDRIRVQPLQQPSCKEDVEQRMVDQPLQPALGGVGEPQTDSKETHNSKALNFAHTAPKSKGRAWSPSSRSPGCRLYRLYHTFFLFCSIMFYSSVVLVLDQ